MLSDEHVIVKGVRDGLLILLDDSADWPALLADLAARLGARRAFFSGASVTANLGARVLDEPEFGALRRLLGGFEMTLDVVVSTSTQTRAVAGANGVRNRAPSFAARQTTPLGEAARPPPGPPAAGGARPAGAPAPPPGGEPDFGALARDGEEETGATVGAWTAGVAAALFVRRTLRSGMSIQHDGDVCILGDVNPGAEVVAAGDVVVWGALRGMVHAGAGGDAAAVVCALLLAPTQLRIGDLVTRGSAPDGPAAPETARIAGNHIVVEPWSGRRR